MLHDPSLIVYYLEIIIGGVFHETFVSFITFEVYMFKDSNLKLMLRQMQKDSKKPHLVDLLPFLIASSMVEKILVSVRYCHFGGVYTFIRQLRKCPVLAVQWGHTHTLTTFFQTIYSNPPEGGRSITKNICVHYNV